MISELEVGRGWTNFRHVAGDAFLGGDFAGNRQTWGARFRLRRRLIFSRMTGEALRIVRRDVLTQWLMRVVAGRAGYPAIIRVAFAVKDAIRLKADIVNLHAAQQTELIATAMTSGAKFLTQFITAETGRVED
jgi:hypothetical protein